MDIQIQTNQFRSLGDPKSSNNEPEEVALKFEKMLTRQLVQQMTKGLFKNDDKGIMMSGGAGLYRQHIVDTLSSKLAKQADLGISKMVLQYIDQQTDNNNI